MADYVGAIDQGTTSTRFVVFDRGGRIIALAQREHDQILPRPGWVEHDAREIWLRTSQVVSEALAASGLGPADLAAVGVTNQRETVVAWDRRTGEPVANAIVWQDTRTDELCRQLAQDGGQDRFRATTGLPLATYFAGPKVRWLLDTVPGLRERAEGGEVAVGTVDSWLVWNLTGGALHVTDVTNASRTLLMDLTTLDWAAELLTAIGVPRAALPDIRSSSEVYAQATVPELAGVPIAAILGDQQAALFGQVCFEPGEVKNTYGTGAFLLQNTGTVPVRSAAGLITTVAYRLGDQAPAYALEGSVAMAGALVQWLRDNLGVIASAAEIEPLARSVEDNGGVYLVPAFSGLFAPHWRSDARGVIAGLTRFAGRGHLARAVLEATAFQCREVGDAMATDSGVIMTCLKVDGGMVRNELLMQFQADILDLPVVRPRIVETTVLGAAYAAGLAVGFWSGLDELRANWVEERRWFPHMSRAERERTYGQWQKAVDRTLNWT